jgi:hypothetical protein
MGDTTAHGLPYPVGTDRVMDGDNAMQALAEAVDTALMQDTGGITPQAAGFTLLTGFTNLSGVVRRRHGIVAASFGFATTNPLPAGDVGNVNAVNLPAGWVPLVRAGLTTGATGPGVFVFADPSGKLGIAATASAVSAGQTITCAGLWMVLS